MSRPLAKEAEIAYSFLLLEAIEISDNFAERLEELYQKYPSDTLGRAIDHLRKVREGLTPAQLPGRQCAPQFSTSSS